MTIIIVVTTTVIMTLIMTATTTMTMNMAATTTMTKSMATNMPTIFKQVQKYIFLQNDK